MQRCEVLIVGGGPAGTSAALALARRRPDLAGRIAVLEKERYPRDKYCAGALGGRADKALRAMGVRVDVPSVPVRGFSAAFRAGEVALRDGENGENGEIGRVVRRIELDHALALAARARGVRVVEGARVTRVAFGERGVVLESAAGAFEGRVVLGADGVGSVVRRAMGLPFGRLRAQVVEVDTEPVPADRPRDLLHFDLRDRSYAGYAWDFPTLASGAELVCRGVYVLHPDAVGAVSAAGAAGAAPPADPEVILRARLAALGLDLDRYRVKRFAERGLEPGLPIARPRALLVGEAAGIDPLFGEGIAQAIAYGALAGDYLAPRLAEGDLRFHDWTSRVRRSLLGADLRARRRLLGRVYVEARGRDLIERSVLDQPPLLRLGMQYFNGGPFSAPNTLRAVVLGTILYGRLKLPA